MPTWTYLCWVVGLIMLLLGGLLNLDDEKDRIGILVFCIGAAIFLAIIGLTEAIFHALKTLKVQ